MVIIAAVVVILGLVICAGVTSVVVLVVIKVVLYCKRRHKLDINQSMLYIMYNVLYMYALYHCTCVTYDRILCCVIVGAIIILASS